MEFWDFEDSAMGRIELPCIQAQGWQRKAFYDLPRS